jgi:hypothetical protein
MAGVHPTAHQSPPSQGLNEVSRQCQGSPRAPVDREDPSSRRPLDGRRPSLL